ncbi:MAG TPA: CmpA/NrtA family ABC transporter substrate-binding protein [Chthoniobacteraceae bacterium]|nr:CmpA/NrtA family ABC transporter substrate-binding protein [Chthoniobacteraceae bacterium]
MRQHRSGIIDSRLSLRGKLRVGYVPMIDCAPLVAAVELGLFTKYGSPVELIREPGWATVREKILHAELDAAHAPASMAFTITCGINVVPRPCLTGLVLNLNGNAITLSNELWDKGVRDATSLKELIDREKGRRTYVFASVLDLSSQTYLLRKWLRSGGIDPDRDVRLVVVPSRLVHENLMEGYLDGYCVAEPWNSILLLEGKAWSVATSAEIDAGHPEKVLLVLQKFAKRYPDLHLAMLAALLEACAFCEEPANRPELIRMLALPRYLNVPERLLENSLLGHFNTGRGVKPAPDFITYHKDGANAPTRAKAKWVYNEIERNDLTAGRTAFRRDVMRKVFREDIYEEALKLMRGSAPSADAGLPGGSPRARAAAAGEIVREALLPPLSPPLVLSA